MFMRISNNKDCMHIPSYIRPILGIFLIGVLIISHVQASESYPPLVITREDVGRIYDTPDPHADVGNYLVAASEQSIKPD